MITNSATATAAATATAITGATTTTTVIITTTTTIAIGIITLTTTGIATATGAHRSITLIETEQLKSVPHSLRMLHFLNGFYAELTRLSSVAHRLTMFHFCASPTLVGWVGGRSACCSQQAPYIWVGPGSLQLENIYIYIYIYLYIYIYILSIYVLAATKIMICATIARGAQRTADSLADVQVNNLRRPFGPWHAACYYAILQWNRKHLERHAVTIRSVRAQCNPDHKAAQLHKDLFQAVAGQCILQTFNKYASEERLRHKLGRWRFHDPPGFVARRAQVSLLLLNQYSRSCVVSSYLRALNGWLTSARMFTIMLCAHAPGPSFRNHCRMDLGAMVGIDLCNHLVRLRKTYLCKTSWRWRSASMLLAGRPSNCESENRQIIYRSFCFCMLAKGYGAPRLSRCLRDRSKDSLSGCCFFRLYLPFLL